MTSGTVKVRLRPIKLAFLVNPKDKESLLKAIEINTFLWGGTYNPIIPTYKRLSSKWKIGSSNDLSVQEVIAGYLDNFDPDYVVPMGECINYELDFGYRKQIEDVSKILEPVEKGRGPNYGIGLFEILDYFFTEELRFQPRYSEDICVPNFNSGYHLFLASVFGTLSKNINTIFWKNFAEPLEAEKIECSVSNYTEVFDLHKLFLRRIAGFYLESTGHYEKPRIFFLDATKPLDIMDYWNLRGIGWHLFPVPKQLLQSDKLKVHILNYIVENLLSHIPNPKVYHKTTILKSRSISEDEHTHFLDLIEELKIVSQTWYPKIWDESARKTQHVECCEIEADTVEHDVSTDQEPIRFKALPPKFSSHLRGGVKPHFANEIEWRLSDDRILFAEVLPDGDSKQALSIVGFGLPDNWRLFKKGLVHLAWHTESTLYLRSPHAVGVFTRWLESKGWAVTLSAPGRVAMQMLQQLGGVMGTWILAQKGIIQLLGKMSSSNEILSELLNQISDLQKLLEQNESQTAKDEVEAFVKFLREIQLGGDEKSMSEEFVRGQIQKIANQMKYKIEGAADRIIQQLVDAKVFQLGIEVQCPVCTRTSWYSVKGAGYDLQCPKCLDQFSFPSTSKKVKWAYRTLGPFSLPNQADGAYTVLLTLRFFWRITFSNGAMTPLMSFTAEKDGMEIEADLALFFQESESRHSKTDLIFAEMKNVLCLSGERC